MRLRAAITGNLRNALKQEVRGIAVALKRGVETTGKQTQEELRQQARGAGFADGGKSVANAWRLEVYPKPGVGLDTFRPAALVLSKMAYVVDLFDKGAVVTVNRGKYLAIPTPVNRTSSRRTGYRGSYPVRVTPQEMFRSGGFTIKTRNPRVRLWCLPLNVKTAKRSGRVRLFAGKYSQIMTGHKADQQASRKAYAAQRKFVPMFFLMQQVTLRKRLNVAAVRAKAAGRYARNATQELNRRA